MRIVLGVVVGFVAWVVVWFSNEQVLTAFWPKWFGVQQRAFQTAIENGGEFTPDLAFLAAHILNALVTSAIAGFIAAQVAGENKKSPVILGMLLLALGVLKMVLSWPYVPIWFHVVFTGILFPVAFLGAQLRTFAVANVENRTP